MPGSLHASNMIGAVVAVVINLLLIMLFIARLKNTPRLEYWLGILIILNIVPLLILLIRSFEENRPTLYFIQIGLMITYLIAELLLDYILKTDFRQSSALVIPYITLFFAATGGMIGVAKYAGKGWIWAASMTFLLMTGLSLYQRSITGQ